MAVAGLGAVQQDQRAGAVLVESLWVRDVQHKVAFGSGARHACQHGTPLRGCTGARVDVAAHGGAVHEVAMPGVVVEVGKACQPRNHATGDVGDLLAAVCGGKAVQHAVVAAHVNHGLALLLGERIGRIARQRRVVHGTAGMPDLGVDDIALA